MKGAGAIAIAVIVLVAVVVAILITLAAGRKPPADPPAGKLDVGRKVPCPVCRTLLARGERIHSLVYPGGNEKLVHILGCPHCYPANHQNRRTCPVCRRPIPSDGFIVGRMSNRQGRQHLHITGCTVCRKRGLVKG